MSQPSSNITIPSQPHPFLYLSKAIYITLKLMLSWISLLLLFCYLIIAFYIWKGNASDAGLRISKARQFLRAARNSLNRAEVRYPYNLIHFIMLSCLHFIQNITAFIDLFTEGLLHKYTHTNNKVKQCTTSTLKNILKFHGTSLEQNSTQNWG